MIMSFMMIGGMQASIHYLTSFIKEVWIDALPNLGFVILHVLMIFPLIGIFYVVFKEMPRNKALATTFICILVFGATYSILNGNPVPEIALLDRHLTRRMCEARFGRRDRYFECVITKENNPSECHWKYQHHGDLTQDCVEQWHWTYGWIYTPLSTQGGVGCNAAYPCLERHHYDEIPSPPCVIL